VIYITKDTTNTICLPLSDASTLVAPYYLFEFVNDSTDNKYYFAQEDASAYKSRYSLFELIENAEGGSSVIDEPMNLEKGQYTYNVYETNTLTNDIEEVVGSAIKTGRMVVVGTELNTIYE
jgi:hypothetical protein